MKSRVFPSKSSLELRRKRVAASIDAPLSGGVVSELGVYRGLPRPAFLAAAQLTVAVGMGALAAFPTTVGYYGGLGTRLTLLA